MKTKSNCKCGGKCGGECKCEGKCDCENCMCTASTKTALQACPCGKGTCGCDAQECPCSKGMHSKCGCHEKVGQEDAMEELPRMKIDSTEQLAPSVPYAVPPNEDTGNNKAYGKLSKRFLK